MNSAFSICRYYVVSSAALHNMSECIGTGQQVPAAYFCTMMLSGKSGRKM